MKHCLACGKVAFGMSGYCTRCTAARQAAQGKLGMEQSAERAERVIEGWGIIAMGFLRDFAEANRGRDYLAEEIAPWAYARECPVAPDDRAWGAVIKAAGKDHTIEPTGLAAKNKLSGHASTWRPLWRTV